MALAAAVVEGKIYTCGGFAADGFTGILEVYDPALDRWEEKAPMPTARGYHAAVALGGKIYAIGGTDFVNDFTEVEVYNPETDEWSSSTPLPAPRRRFSAAVFDETIYIFGSDSGERAILAFNPASATWDSVGVLPEQREGHAMVLFNAKFFLIGGTSPTINYLINVDVWEPLSGLWFQQSPMPDPRRELTADVVGEKVFVVGGWNAIEGHLFFRDLLIFDIETRVWTRGAAMAYGRHNHSAAVVNGRLYVFGGLSDSGPPICAAVEVYQP